MNKKTKEMQIQKTRNKDKTHLMLKIKEVELI